MSVGTRVYNLDGVPIPLARQAVHMLQVVGGIHIRRSSESPEKLEMNLFDETGANADNLLGKTIEDVFFKEDFLRCRAEYIMDINNISDFHQYYISYLQNRVNMEYVKIHPPTVFVISDCEAMLSFVRTIFTHVNIPICGEMYVDKFEPKKIRSVEHFIHADLTAFIDRNGEKLVLLDSGGKVLDETRLFLLHAYLLFKTIPGYNIFAPLNMTAALEHMAEDFGGSVKRTKTSGNAVLRELMKADVFADNLNQYMLQFDAVASLVKTVEYLSSQNTTLDNLLKFIPRHFIKHALILCPLEAIGRVMRILHQESGCKKQLFDGIRIILEQGWVLIMPDAEKPFIHLYVEGNSSKEANMLLSNYSARIKKLTAGDVNI
jgi:mannose-1-phosphate guanylyltransferase/phosphomannomutase